MSKYRTSRPRVAAVVYAKTTVVAAVLALAATVGLGRRFTAPMFATVLAVAAGAWLLEVVTDARKAS